MNTYILQQKYPKIYQDFFSRSQKVASAPHSFFWSGDFSGFYGGLTILQKIPLRFYVGLQKISPEKFEIKRTFPAYSSSLKKFTNIRLDDFLYEKLNKILAEDFKGYKIRFLSEVSLGSSLGSLGALSACLAGLQLTDYDFLTTATFRTAWDIVKQLQQGRTSGATAFAALSSSPYPVVFHQKGTKYWGKSLDEIFSLPSQPVWPIDFGLIFSGNLVQGAAVIASAEEVKNILEKREVQIKKALGANFTNSFWETYLAMLNQVASQNLIAFSDLFKKGASLPALEFFFNTLNQYQNLLRFLEISTKSIDRIYSKIHKLADKTENQVGSGAKISGVGKGGEVLFAVPFGQYREKISNLSLDYCSWEDGFENQGLKIEQDVEKAVYSKFIKEGSFLLKIYQKDDFSCEILDKDELEKTKKKVDLLLDTTTSKIYIKGRGLTSKILPSQKATVEILTKLLTTNNQQLSNSGLPSAYSQSRYDLQSKITSPLSRLLPLRFEIKGGMYEDYTLKLQPFEIKIGIVEKII